MSCQGLVVPLHLALSAAVAVEPLVRVVRPVAARHCLLGNGCDACRSHPLLLLTQLQVSGDERLHSRTQQHAASMRCTPVDIPSPTCGVITTFDGAAVLWSSWVVLLCVEWMQRLWC